LRYHTDLDLFRNILNCFDGESKACLFGIFDVITEAKFYISCNRNLGLLMDIKCSLFFHVHVTWTRLYEYTIIMEE